MAYKRCLVAKKNLFNINASVDYRDGMTIKGKDIICTYYGAWLGTLHEMCPSLKAGDVITLSTKLKSTTGVAPEFIQIQGQVLYIFPPNAENHITITVTEEGLTKPIYLYNTNYANSSVPTTSVYTDFMVEKGSIATAYVPYGYLPSYKSKLKIAKVNQLLDKSKFPATVTLNGVTITNNNDGSFTFTVGVTTTGTIGYLKIIDNYPLKKGHRYICPVQELKIGDTSSYVELVITKSDGNSIWTNDYLVEEDGMICRVGCLKYGTDTTPHIVKPILVDLTEMYGPQHMPTDDKTFFADYPTQALDKTKFSLGQTIINGITFTNNNDGTITVNGTATARATYVVENVYTEIVGHKCLLRGCPLGGSTSTYVLHDSSWGVVDIGHGIIANIANKQIVIDVFAGVVCENLIFKPELVDLTALGLDSTITSPEQFNPKVDYIPFVYDYAPKCWLTSYKHNLIATTKNLYDGLNHYAVSKNWPANKKIWTGNIAVTCCFSFYQNLSDVNSPSGALFRFEYSDNSVSYRVPVNQTGLVRADVVLYPTENKRLIGITIVNYSSSTGDVYNMLLEKGSTPTEYVPNGYL